MVCITINFSEPQILWFIIKSGFKSRPGYNGSCMVLYCNVIILGLDYKDQFLGCRIDGTNYLGKNSQSKTFLEMAGIFPKLFSLPSYICS